jgi:tetratricopeptide (TPR) repeat protein
MKAIKYLVAGVMMLSISAPTMAQTDKAQFDAIAKTIVDKNGDANALKDDIKAFTKLYKKNPEAMANIGRAFLEVDNYEKANEYADLAIKVGKNKAAGYLLKGDIARKQDDGGEAATWYQQATIFDKEDPTGYVKYARVYQKVDPKGAVDMLEQLRKVKPDYPVDAAAGYMYSNAKKLKTAMDYYDKVPNPTQLEDYILYDYTSTAYAIEDYEKAFRLAEIGSRTYTDYSSFNRVAFYSQYMLKDYNTALTYATKLFNNKDTLKFTANDYQN